MNQRDTAPRGHREKGERSRKRLIDEATRLFGLYGYAAVTIREIGAAAGLDNSTIYRYFESKEHLASEVVLQLLADLAPLVQRMEVEREPTLQQLSEGVVAFSRHLWDRRDVARLLLAWMSTTGDRRSGFSFSIKLSENTEHPAAQLVARIFGWFARAQSAGVLRPIAPIDALVNILALAVVRSATAGYFLHSLEQHIDESTRQKTSEAELRASIHGAFAPLREPKP